MRIDVFVDESGDLGFNPRSSKIFVVSYFITQDTERIRINTKRLLKRINNKYKRTISEFKFSKDSHETRMRFFNLIKRMDIVVGCVVIEKRTVKDELKEKHLILYNYLTVNYVITNILSRYEPNRILFIMDKSLSKKSIMEFNNYLKGKVSWKSFVMNKNESDIDVCHINSQDEPCIQVADYLAGAVFSKFEHNNNIYYDLIKDKIQFKNSWGRIEW
jgi:hypothetical protein